MYIDFYLYLLIKVYKFEYRQHIYIHNITIPVKYNLAGQNTKI